MLARARIWRRRRYSPWTRSLFSSRWPWLVPLLSIAFFVCVMLAVLWMLNENEKEREKASLVRDVEWTQQVIRLHLQSQQDELTVLAREVAQAIRNETSFGVRARRLMLPNPEMVSVAWVDLNRMTRWSEVSDIYFESDLREIRTALDDGASSTAFSRAQTSRQPTWSQVYQGSGSEAYFDLHVPVLLGGRFLGTVNAVYSVERVLRFIAPKEITPKYQLVVVGEANTQLAALAANPENLAKSFYEVPFTPPGGGARLRAHPYPASQSLADNFLMWLVVVLSVFIMWSLWSLMRHMHHRMEAEAARDRLFNLSLDILCVMDRSGTLMRINPAVTEVLGADPDELLGTSLLDLIHPDDRESTEAELRRLATGEANSSFENRCRRRNEDGTEEYRWLLWAFNPDLQAKPASRLLYAVAHDVTLLRARQLALMAETAFRRAMEDSILTGMRALDMDGRITYVNRAFCRMIGWDEKDLIGALPPYPYWPHGKFAQHRESLGQILAGKTPAAGLEVRVMRKDGRHFDARMYVSPLIDADGHQTGWMTSMTDITEPKRIREELAAAHERFTTVLEELEAAVSVYAGAEDKDTLLFANRYYLRLFGANAAGHRELTLPLVLARHHREDGNTNEIYSASLGKWFDVRQRTIQWVDGRLVQLQVATDITARHKAEGLARQQEEKVQLTSRLMTMGEMASSLAHELNQPLTAIANYNMGSVARLKAGLEKRIPFDPGELLGSMQKASAQAERAGQIIRRIREFVKRSEPRRRRCNVRSIVDDAVGFAEIEATKRRINIRTMVDQQVGDISADPILIEQVLLNLLKNGAEAMHHNGPQEGVRDLLLEVKDTGNHVEFAVIDQGPGIDPEAYEQLFEPFYSTKTEGMGMGLNICRTIIEFHHGRLWAENNPGGGCTFRFSLPHIDTPTDTLHAVSSAPASASATQTAPTIASAGEQRRVAHVNKVRATPSPINKA